LLGRAGPVVYRQRSRVHDTRAGSTRKTPRAVA
jgi:hypothetical protein